ncbi:MAG: hypothetical protein CW338_06565 [Clostridiales bacterium]|nr:hypothetical protein [Clostridiales bacterium]
MKCVIVRGTDELHVGLGFLDISGDLQKEQEQAERERLYQELMNSMSRDDGLFLIDCVKNTRKTLRDNSDVAASFSDDEDYITLIGRYVDRCVADSDQNMMDRMTAPSYMLQRTKTDKEYSVDFRDISTGVQRFYEMRIVRISNTEVLQSFTRRDDEIIGRLMFRKLEADYFALVGVDLDTGILRVMKNNPGIRLDKPGETMFYGPAMREIASSFEGEYREFFEKIGDVNYIRKRFAHEEKSTYIYRSHMGGGLWGQVTGMVVSRHDDGTPSLFVLGFSILDTDANEQAELRGRLQSALHKSREESMRNELLHSILHAARWTFIVSADDEVIGVQASDDLRNLLNADIPDGPMGWTSLIYPDDRERVLGEFMAAVEDHSGKTPYDTTYRMADRDGAVRWYRSAGRVFRHEDGFGEFFGMHIDITGQMKERHQEEKWAYLKEFGDMVNSALWSMDIAGEDTLTGVYWSSELRHMFGFENKKDFPDELSAWSGRLHPEDRERVMNYLHKCFVSRTEGVIHSLSYRLMKKDGEYGRFNAYGRIENHPDGTRRLYGIVKDFTARERYDVADTEA